MSDRRRIVAEGLRRLADRLESDEVLVSNNFQFMVDELRPSAEYIERLRSGEVMDTPAMETWGGIVTVSMPEGVIDIPTSYGGYEQ